MQHRRTTAASMFQNGISRNTKCDIMVSFPKSSHNYLTIPKLPQKPNTKEETGARIVTSYEFLAELQEKEEKKKQAEEEKIQRKLERERRKKEKEAKKEEAMKQKRLKTKGKTPIKTRQKSESTCTTTMEPKLNTRKRNKCNESSDEEIDENTCCVCFDVYHSDEDWIQCSCSRWLHEECSLCETPNVLETCPYCVMYSTTHL